MGLGVRVEEFSPSGKVVWLQSKALVRVMHKCLYYLAYATNMQDRDVVWAWVSVHRARSLRILAGVYQECPFGAATTSNQS